MAAAEKTKKQRFVLESWDPRNSGSLHFSPRARCCAISDFTGEVRAMNDASRRRHWDNVYETKGEDEVSWFQESPALSLELMALVGATRLSAVIDVGGGASRLVDHLVALYFEDVTILDLSEAALATAKARLGDKSARVRWIAADITEWEPRQAYNLWHDRAAFHFLTIAADRAAYIERLRKSLKPGGDVIIGTFAPDGPERCSGLPVTRHDAASLGELLGEGFTLIDARPHEHATPWGALQRFQFSTFRKL
jgi:SAM-dependent methyltransferase